MNKENTNIEDEKNHPLYKKFKSKALSVKIFLQMMIGLTIIILLLIKLIAHICEPHGYIFLDALINNHPLHIVGYSLAVSSCVELAYMLFTPGPDEAIEPLILGMSAAILLIISDTKIVGYDIALTIFVLTAAIGFLFWIKNIFID